MNGISSVGAQAMVLLIEKGIEASKKGLEKAQSMTGGDDDKKIALEAGEMLATGNFFGQVAMNLQKSQNDAKQGIAQKV